MLVFLVTLLLGITFAQVRCDDSKNDPFTNLNEVCSYAGTCIEGYCVCCSLNAVTLEPSSICPGWNEEEIESDYDKPEKDCDELVQNPANKFNFYFAPGAPGSPTLACLPDRVEEIRDLVEQFYNDHGYPGKIVVFEGGCTECKDTSPCPITDPETGRSDMVYSGMTVNFGTDLSTYYDMSCYDPTDEVPEVYEYGKCEANYDAGYKAKLAFGRVKTYNEAEPDAWNGEGFADMFWLNTQMNGDPMRGITGSDYNPMQNHKSIADREIDPCINRGYTNHPNDLQYLGDYSVGCRGGISDSWTGGKTCESPYVVCLPEENTPNQAPKHPFFGTDHKYSVAECKVECAFDQRCRGIEFKATSGNTGDCILLDDIQLQGEGSRSGYEYDAGDGDLTGKTLCFGKGGETADYCNPFFEASDLNEVMLGCYCPNNRKGFYTKKVKRIVENTRYCDRGDANVDALDVKIKQAQANRMFHLCENWCLFDTFDPEAESWYWDPWKTCWREQYSGTDAHMTYCHRVIRDPGTIEQQWIMDRVTRFCP